jgi:hypothetical protein
MLLQGVAGKFGVPGTAADDVKKEGPPRQEAPKDSQPLKKYLVITA